MRLLHTSDWHLGRPFHGASRLQEQALAMDRLVELAAEARVDAVLIAGDLYDRAIPPAEAVQLFNDTLARLSRLGCSVVAIAGNHDSHVRVSVYDPLLSAFGVTIRGDVRRADEPVLVQPRDGGAPVAIYPLPYLEPSIDGPLLLQHPSAAVDGLGEETVREQAVREDSVGEDALSLEAAGLESGGEEAAGEDTAAGGRPGRISHAQVIALALQRIRLDLGRRRQVDPALRSVLVAHAFVAGGEGSESERELSVGNADRVPVEIFQGFDYVALGHLHGSQQLDGPRLAYSGTPLAYSFSEQHHRKSVRIVELATDGTASVECVPLGVGRPLRTLEGPLDSLCLDPRYDDARPCWLRVILTDPDLPIQAMARLRQRFPDVAELRHRPPEHQRSTAGSRQDQIQRARSPLDLTLAFYADQQGRPASDAEAELLRRALATTLHGGER